MDSTSTVIIYSVGSAGQRAHCYAEFAPLTHAHVKCEKKRHPCCERSAGRVAYDRIVLSGCYVMVDRPRVTEIQVHVTTPIVDRMCMCEL